MAAGPEGGDDEAEAEADSGVEHGAPRTCPLQPRSEECGRDAEKGDRDGENIADLLQVPVRAVSGLQGKKWIFEDGKCIGLAYRKMDGEGSGGNQPATISCGGDGVVTVKKSQGHIQKPRGIF